MFKSASSFLSPLDFGATLKKTFSFIKLQTCVSLRIDCCASLCSSCLSKQNQCGLDSLQALSKIDHREEAEFCSYLHREWRACPWETTSRRCTLLSVGRQNPAYLQRCTHWSDRRRALPPPFCRAQKLKCACGALTHSMANAQQLCYYLYVIQYICSI